MKKGLPLFLGLIALSACDNKKIIELDCGGNNVAINMSEDGEHLSTVINGENVDFNIAVSASGVRYVAQMNNSEVTLWNKGTDWTLYLNEETPIMCVSK